MQWKTDPSSVHSSWDAYFRTGAYVAPPTLMPSGYVPTPVGHLAGGTSLSASAGAGAGQPVGDAQRIMQMIKAFQYKGHLLSTLDPLGMMGPRDATVAADLKLERYGFTPADLKKEFNLAFMSGIKGTCVRGYVGTIRID